MSRPGKVRIGAVRLVWSCVVEQAEHGRMRRGSVRNGKARQARLVWSGCGPVRMEAARQAWRSRMCPGKDW